jgi:hypothetical protein
MVEIIRNSNGLYLILTGSDLIKDNMNELSYIAAGLDDRLKNYSFQEQEEIKFQAKDQAILCGKVRS